MAITVEHRRDNLLQHSVEKGIEPGLEDTYIGQVTVPTHGMLLAFLDERIVGQQFENMQALSQALHTWSQFAESHGLPLHRDWEEIEIVEGNSIACGESPGGDFIIGHIVKN